MIYSTKYYDTEVNTKAARLSFVLKYRSFTLPSKIVFIR